MQGVHLDNAWFFYLRESESASRYLNSDLSGRKGQQQKHTPLCTIPSIPNIPANTDYAVSSIHLDKKKGVCN